MTDITIRAATAADAAALAFMEAMLFSDAWSEKSVGETLSSPFTAALVAECGGECIGYLLSSLLAPEGELLRIGVHPRRRREGLGGRLMARFLTEAKDRGCTDIFLEVRADNGGAIALYRRAGFLENGLRRGYYKNPAADALLMRLSLVGYEKTLK
ncbi:MAG: ribosomal protein S18-alanine N-acetyltransferase [Clostridia bacterium]|nr:ribosomal protein S18-alanine N-acetyltransferase [Clostridia bacterium]MBR2325448.1 ribosomal protein S18-alanine N-acetyltransferase [Clostridia bacterium]